MTKRNLGFWSACAFALAATWPCPGIATAQQAPAVGTGEQVPEDERIKALTDPEAVKKRLLEKDRPAYEIFRSQVAPFDILPYVKANHWSSVGLELRVNHLDYAGRVETAPVPLRSMPHAVVYRRDARLVNGQISKLSWPMFLPEIPKELGLDLIQPDALRPDDSWMANLLTLEPHQMLVLVLTRDSGDIYNPWSRLRALMADGLGDEAMSIERQRYYRLVVPLDPDKPLLSPQPLTWPAISHVVWDNPSPGAVGLPQQAAMLDWLHWGGQLVIAGGASGTYGALREGFLGPYLPAEPTGEDHLLGEADLAPLSRAYPPPTPPLNREEIRPEITSLAEANGIFGERYRPAEPIRPASNRPVFFAGLRPRPGARAIPLGDAGGTVLAVEARVGRGRIAMLSFNPNDPALAAWPGFDTLISGLILRRPEEPLIAATRPNSSGAYVPPHYRTLSGPELTWVRHLARDLDDSKIENTVTFDLLQYHQALQAAGRRGRRLDPPPVDRERDRGKPSDPAVLERPGLAIQGRTGAWVDDSSIPTACRTALESASGLSIPSSGFVLRVVLAYAMALVPLNWLICRFVLRRREWAWAIVPVLALGFAAGVERYASFDLGYDSACDEIDLLELQGGHVRAHLSRFGSIYSSGRVDFTIGFPNDPTALALPLDNGRSLRGESQARSVWRSTPSPALVDLRVQPRSQSMYRSEQMAPLPGAIALEGEGDKRRVVNRSGIELRDAILIDDASGGGLTIGEAPARIVLGTIAAGASVAVPGEASAGDAPIAAVDGPSPHRLLRLARRYRDPRPEARGEVRLVAWSPVAMPGRTVEPAVDRERGVTVVVAHLQYGPVPDPEPVPAPANP